jgi:hypothetical protein
MIDRDHDLSIVRLYIHTASRALEPDNAEPLVLRIGCETSLAAENHALQRALM